MLNHVNPSERIRAALEILNLPPLISLRELKAKYRDIAKKHHQDSVAEEAQMVCVNLAYETLKEYMEKYRFSFSDEEILKQFPEESHAVRFKF